MVGVQARESCAKRVGEKASLIDLGAAPARRAQCPDTTHGTQKTQVASKNAPSFHGKVSLFGLLYNQLQPECKSEVRESAPVIDFGSHVSCLDVLECLLILYESFATSIGKIRGWDGAFAHMYPNVRMLYNILRGRSRSSSLLRSSDATS